MSEGRLKCTVTSPAGRRASSVPHSLQIAHCPSLVLWLDQLLALSGARFEVGHCVCGRVAADQRHSSHNTSQKGGRGWLRTLPWVRKAWRLVVAVRYGFRGERSDKIVSQQAPPSHPFPTILLPPSVSHSLDAGNVELQHHVQLLLTLAHKRQDVVEVWSGWQFADGDGADFR